MPPDVRSSLLVAAALLCSACADSSGQPTAKKKQVPDGDPERGQAILAGGAYGCTACHSIPGIRSQQGVVGPPLNGMADRAFIAGQLPNTPDVLIAFLQDPSSLVPQTGMPDVRLGRDDARDVAAYLYSLEPSHAR